MDIFKIIAPSTPSPKSCFRFPSPLGEGAEGG